MVRIQRPLITGEHVVFLGAGTSRAFGHALTSDILPQIVRRLRSDSFRDKRLKDDRARAILEAAIQAILPGASPDLELPLVTHVLSLLDYCVLNQERLSPDVDIERARELFDLAIIDILDKTIHDDATVTPRELVTWILKARATVVSTNYDTLVDEEILWEGLENWDKEYAFVDFGFTWRTVDTGELVPPESRPRLALYKLHGSFNWLKCHRCGHIYVNFGASIARWTGKRGLASTCHCGNAPLRSIIVAPSFVRTVRDANLLSIWQQAGEAMRNARRWTFIGYALPEEDIAIRSMLLRAFHGSPRRPLVHVVNLKEKDFLPYRLLFGDITTTPDGLQAFLSK
jgi:hypothetical protein